MVVVSTAGGWGVVTADALARTGLELIGLPDDLRVAIDAELPPRWSRNNPIDMAGGETRDTVPKVLELAASHPDVDAVIFLGMGIQANQAQADAGGAVLARPRPRAHRRLPRAPGRPLRRGGGGGERGHRQAHPQRHRAGDHLDRGNPAPAGVRASGRLCYASANRAVTALDHLWRRSRWLQRRGLAIR